MAAHTIMDGGRPGGWLGGPHTFLYGLVGCLSFASPPPPPSGHLHPNQSTNSKYRREKTKQRLSKQWPAVSRHRNRFDRLIHFPLPSLNRTGRQAGTYTNGPWPPSIRLLHTLHIKFGSRCVHGIQMAAATAAAALTSSSSIQLFFIRQNQRHPGAIVVNRSDSLA